MANARTTVASLFVIAFCAAAPARPDDDSKPAMTPQQFADRLTNVIRAVAGSYYYEIDSADLLRWAVKGLYDRLGREVPEEFAGRLAKARDPDKKELHDLLISVAADCG